MKNKIKNLSLLFSVYLLPLVSLAQLDSQADDFSSLQSGLEALGAIINFLIPLLIGVAVIVFIVGVIRYVLAGGDSDKKQSAVKFLVSGIIGLFVIVSIWGIISILQDTFGVNDSGREVGSSDIPTIPGL